jgi:ubiquinone/menaquinone biosynthesis C-methylase UbiE
MAVSTTQQTDALRAQLHGMWSRVAPAWEAHGDYIEHRGAPLTARLLELTAPGPGERVLELAAGTGVGGPGFGASPLIGEQGEAVVSDVAREMVDYVAAHAESLGLENVATRVLDLEAIDEADASFDVVFCREGLMLVPDPELAARELRRVLRPGGRLAVSVWGPRARNPWLSVVFRVVGEHLGQVPPPGVPHPFSLDDPGRLAEVLRAGGFGDVEVDELSLPYRAHSADEWWERTKALAGPLAERLAALPDEAARVLAERSETEIAAFATPGGLEIPGVALVAFAKRS